MSDYRKGAHTVFAIHLHVVWITKYRKAILAGPVGLRVRAVVRGVCDQMNVQILKGHVAGDHVHLMLSVPPKVRISDLLQRLKGRSANILLDEFAHLRKAFWGRHVWARGYFCCSSGNITDDMVKAYIENQTVEDDDDFRVEEGGTKGRDGPPPA
ncbi:IS200/IS605 family transposase [bacterium]|nr:IS200/IS605 family transposase [bacterium]